MKYRLLAIGTAVAALLALVFVGSGHADPPRWQPKPGLTWQWQLSGTINTSVNADVFDIDWEQPKSVVDTLHAKGKKVICYVDVGGWENYRPDASSYPASVLGSTVGGWPDERYVDVRAQAILQPILLKRFQACKDKGFDAVETDLDDQYDANTGFPLTSQSYKTFNTWVAADIHSLGMAWFFKNGVTSDPTFVSYHVPLADGTVNESCWQYNECDPVKAFIAAGKPVFNAEYTGTQANICPKATAAGFATIRKATSLNATIYWSCPVTQPPATTTPLVTSTTTTTSAPACG